MTTFELSHVAETAICAAAFCAVFLYGKNIHVLAPFFRDQRSIISFSAGMSVAYVFIRVMPELQEAQIVFKENSPFSTPLEGKIIHLAALVGFLLFYGFERLSSDFKLKGDGKNHFFTFNLDVGGFAIYVWVMSYLLLNTLRETHYSILFYGVAITLHFLTIAHALQREHQNHYDNYGRYILSAAVIFGWICGILFPLPLYLIAPFVAMTSGSIIITSMLTELSHENHGRFIPFVCGGLIYGIVLLPFS
jgi:Kef-type K+ transport system membrane component KefB